MNSLHLFLTHAPSPQIFSHWTIPSLSGNASRYCTPFLSLFLLLLEHSPLSFFRTFLLFFFYRSPELWFSSLCPTSVPLLLCVVSQALRVLCIPQTQCHPFILHQETLTPIIWRVHKAAQSHDPEDEGRIETDGQRAGRKMESETDEGDFG